MFKDKRYFNIDEIVEAFLSNWEDGQKDVFRGYLAKYFEQIEDALKAKLVNSVVSLAENNPDNKDRIFYDLMKQLAPNIKKLYWKGFCFNSVHEYGERLINESLKRNFKDMDLLETAQDINFLSILREFGTKENNGFYKDIIDRLVNFLQSVPLDVYKNAVRVGNSITGKHYFVIGNEVFRNFEHFDEFIKSENATEFLHINREEILNIYGNDINYRNVLEKLLKDNFTKVLNKLQAGESINFGTYQNYPIKWVVLKKNEKSILLITANSLFSRQFNKKRNHLWTFSSLRKYLNSAFYYDCFSADEKLFILKQSHALFFSDKISIPTVNLIRKYSKEISNCKFGNFRALTSFNLMSLFLFIYNFFFNLLFTLLVLVEIGVAKIDFFVIAAIILVVIGMIYPMALYVLLCIGLLSDFIFVCTLLRGVTLVNNNGDTGPYRDYIHLRNTTNYLNDNGRNITDVPINESYGVRVVIRLKLDEQ